jgi:hypothetical protein
MLIITNCQHAAIELEFKAEELEILQKSSNFKQITIRRKMPCLMPTDVEMSLQVWNQ